MRTLPVRNAASILLVVAGCGDWEGIQRRAPAEIEHSNIEVVEIGARILSESEVLGLPSDIAIIGNRLVVIDMSGDPALLVFDRASGVFERSLGGPGEGPGEFKVAWSLDPVPGSDLDLWVYDISLTRLTKISLVPNPVQARDVNGEIVSLRSEGMPTGPLWLDDDTIVSLGLFPGGRLAFFDNSGAQTASTGSVPPGPSNVPASVRQHAYQATMVVHPRRRMLAAVTRRASKIEIYRSDGSPIVQVDGPLPFEVTYALRSSPRGPVFKTEPYHRLGYIDGTGSSEYIFALFSGRTWGEFSDRAGFGRFVHIFDWDGTFKRALRLDQDVLSIAVDKESTTLYAVRHYPHPAILLYSLVDEVL